jgi:molybdopterin/thiamine biosynthesis adenylyltransferase
MQKEVSNVRYDRQLLIPQIGMKGQKKLEQSTVTVIGTGGLGSPVLTYLTCAGVGTIRIFDCDVISESNLNRQFLHYTGDVGNWKPTTLKN